MNNSGVISVSFVNQRFVRTDFVFNECVKLVCDETWPHYKDAIEARVSGQLFNLLLVGTETPCIVIDADEKQCVSGHKRVSLTLKVAGERKELAQDGKANN